MDTKTRKNRTNVWGDENREKLNQSSPSIAKQLTDIVNPVKLLDSIFSQKSSENSQFPDFEGHKKIRSQETLVFSYKATHEDRQLQEETAQILAELKKQVTVLEKSEKALTREISRVKVEQLPAQTGIYYLRYFEWMLGVVRGIRVKIDEGRAWLATFNTRKEKKNGYWKRYKKHGTTFGLSQERTLSTQTG